MDLKSDFENRIYQLKREMEKLEDQIEFDRRT